MFVRVSSPCRSLFGSLLLVLVAHGPVAFAQEQVKFAGASAPGYAAIEQVTATLQMPKNVTGPVPAVAIFHGSGGIDGRGAFHAQALNQAGIATLEVFMFNRGQRLREGHAATLTHAFGALKFLAERPDIDPQKIGAMGFSWGGNLSLRAASKPVHEKFFPQGQPRFAAHAPFYAVWWSHSQLVTDAAAKGVGDYAKFTGAPIMLFAGGRDDYGAPDDAQTFLSGLTPEAQTLFRLQFYPDATHGWDTPGNNGRTLFDPVAHKGKGGQVRFYPDEKVAADSRTRVVQFFQESFAAAAK
ncbi:MAG: dienelactone hydrolase family protein [Rhodoferax sp.]|uniref:dienelactone hydrolase family protein n=1 Tax=Rhodoferax sp. TaxID=50421 RepID=UPI002621BB30|nr:dienelactone hydrolase family protein [Rhodoferax sp.]MDD2878865.1 dienelactone hydrolase family protein [Rhodoferax sp.]